MKFFKGKAAKWIATTVIGGALLYIGVPPHLATPLANWGGEQAQELIE
ncbi:hypothetical protein [Marinomonas posidonica]